MNNHNNNKNIFFSPIHAFPVLNKEITKEIFPRYIDFGTVELGTTSYLVLKILLLYLFKEISDNLHYSLKL